MSSRRRDDAILKPRNAKPSGGNQHHQVSEPLPVEAFGTVRLGRYVPELVVDERHRAGLEEFVERVDDELQREDQQEYRRHLKKTREVDATPVTRPGPRKKRCAGDAD